MNGERWAERAHGTRWTVREDALVLKGELSIGLLAVFLGRTKDAIRRRRQVLRCRDASNIPHGTVDGYHRYLCRCDACRAVWRDHFRERTNTRRCTRPNCGRSHYAKGFCKAHYGRHLRGAPMDAPLRDRPAARRRTPSKDWVNRG